MMGFFKGIVVGLASFALGFAVLSVVLPVEGPEAPPVDFPVAPRVAPAPVVPSGAQSPTVESGQDVAVTAPVGAAVPPAAPVAQGGDRLLAAVEGAGTAAQEDLESAPVAEVALALEPVVVPAAVPEVIAATEPAAPVVVVGPVSDVTPPPGPVAATAAVEVTPAPEPVAVPFAPVAALVEAVPIVPELAPEPVAVPSALGAALVEAAPTVSEPTPETVVTPALPAPPASVLAAPIAPLAVPVAVAPPPAPVVAPAPAQGDLPLIETPTLPEPVAVAPDAPRALPGGTAGIAVRRGTSDGSGDGSGDGATPPTLPGFIRPVEGVTAGRLPSVGAVPPPTEAARPAAQRFASPVSLAPGERGLGLVILEAPEAEEALLSLRFPVTIALDPFAPDAPRRAAAYRQAGHEVALLALGLPPQADATDVAVTLEAWRRQFPQALALIDPETGGVGGNRGLAQALAAELQTDGIGLIVRGAGIDPLMQAARGAGLAWGAVYRHLDDAGQSATTIRRLLERAAFEAERQAGVIIVGQAMNADTMAVLNAWSQGEGRAGVVLVPAGSVLAR